MWAPLGLVVAAAMCSGTLTAQAAEDGSATSPCERALHEAENMLDKARSIVASQAREIARLKADLKDAAQAGQTNSSDLPKLMRRFRRDNFDFAGNIALANTFDAAGEVGRPGIF